MHQSASSLPEYFNENNNKAHNNTNYLTKVRFRWEMGGADYLWALCILSTPSREFWNCWKPAKVDYQFYWLQT